MTLLGRLDRWKSSGLITAEQLAPLHALQSRRLISLYLEINAVMLVGVLAIITGIGWTIEKHFVDLGVALILSLLSVLLAASIVFCYFRQPPYSRRKVESVSQSFDYVLYFGCLLYSVEVGFIESHFHPLGAHWHHYLLFSAGLFFLLSYRFDSRFVLSLALSSLAAWFGFKLSALGIIEGSVYRTSAIVYGGLLIGAGFILSRLDLKRHFLGTYLNIGLNFFLGGLLAGVFDSHGAYYLAALLLGSLSAILYASRIRQFVYLAYGVVYAYIGISYRVIREFHDMEPILAYFVASGIVVVAILVTVARSYGREG